MKSAERPLCALMNVYLSAYHMQKIGGDGRGEKPHDVALACENLLSTHFNLPHENYTVWRDALDGETLRSCDFKNINGLELSPYQQDAVSRLTVAGGVLAMGCGLGKTITAISAALALTCEREAPPRLYIACPLNAMPAWEEYRQWCYGAGFEAYEVISIDSLHKLKGFGSIENSVIVYDEVHLLGNTTARRAKAAHELRKAFTAGICLTGTLLHGGVEKVLSVLDLAIPGAARFSNKWNCGKEFSCIASKPMGARKVRELVKPPKDVLPEFNSWLSTYCQSLNTESATVKDEINLPTHTTHDVEFPTHESIDDAAVRIAEEIFKDTGVVPHMQEVAHVLSRDGVEQKLAWLGGMMGTVPAVIFATYHETLDAIEALLKSKSCTYVRVDGSVTGKQRSACLADFQEGRVQYFLAQTDAASVSMNLQRAHITVMFDASWKAANYDQALARTWRRGQQHPCHHFNLIANAFQKMVWKRVKAAMDFDASVAEWQATKASIDTALGAA